MRTRGERRRGVRKERGREGDRRGETNEKKLHEYNIYNMSIYILHSSLGASLPVHVC